jgi:ribosomal protein S17
MIGTVIRVGSGQMAIIEVSRHVIHSKYHKRLLIRSRFMVHDEIGVKNGDVVRVKQKSVSKRKRHIIQEKI